MSAEPYQYGVDVAAARADDVDRLLLAAVARTAVHTIPSVLDLGCGSGGHATRLAAAGAAVTGVDIQPPPTKEHNTYTYEQADIRTYVADLTQSFDFVCCQRTLHYLPYAAALTLLTRLTAHTSQQLYLSVTGTESLIGRQHRLLTKPVTDRFAVLPPAVQKTFSITAPITVYAQIEVFTLLEQAGWYVENIWTSAFGNVKAVARTSE